MGIHVLVATAETQGRRRSDFCFASEGEPVDFPACACDHTVDGPCGCKRSLTGLQSRRGTTTVKVAALDLTPDAFHAQWVAAQVAAGWLGTDLATWPPATRAWADSAPAALLRLAAAFPAGTVLERRGRQLRPRPPSGPSRVTAATPTIEMPSPR